MPHQCTACGHTFEDGSKEMLSGCPSCGGTTFQFRPSGAAGDDSTDDAPTESTPETPPDRDGGVAERMGRTATAMRDWMHGDEPSGSGRTEGPADTPPAEASSDAPSADASSADASSADASTADTQSAADTGEASSDGTSTDRPSTAEASPPEGGAADSTPPVDEQSADETPSSEEPTDERPSTAWPDPPDVSHVREESTQRRRASYRSRDEATEQSADETAAGPEPDGTAAPEDDEDGLIVADEEPVDGTAEDTAQASARSEMARPDELPPRQDPDAPTSGRVVSEPSGEKPDMAELRAELNEQFESIKIVEPGQYELNLMELYDRQEYIVALQENGRYVIQMPEDWIGDTPD